MGEKHFLPVACGKETLLRAMLESINLQTGQVEKENNNWDMVM